MTDRQALRFMLISAQREAEDQELDFTSYLLSLAIASLMPEGLRPDQSDSGPSVSEGHPPHSSQDKPLQ